MPCACLDDDDVPYESSITRVVSLLQGVMRGFTDDRDLTLQYKSTVFVSVPVLKNEIQICAVARPAMRRLVKVVWIGTTGYSPVQNCTK